MKIFYRKHGKRYSHHIDVDIADPIRIRFQYVKEVVAEIKAMAGARWNPEKKEWTVKLNERNLTALNILQGDYTIYDWYNQPLITKYDNFGLKLFNHQDNHVRFILTKKRVLIAGEPGVGKSLPSMIALKNTACTTPVIIGPHSALQQWRREIVKWKMAYDYPWRFSTYEGVPKLQELIDLGHMRPDFIILDESVKIKNPAAQRTKNVFKFVESAAEDAYVVCLSGMPDARDPRDWWAQLEVLCPGYVREGDPRKLGYRLGVWEETGEYYNLVCWDEPELAAFAKRIAPVVYSIRKRDVFDFPDKIFDPISIPISEEYKTLAKFWSQTETNSLTLLTRLRELSDGFSLVADNDGDIKTVNGNFKLVDLPDSPKELLLKELLDFYEEAGRIVIAGAFGQTLLKIERCCKAMGWNIGISAGRARPSIEFLNAFDSDSASRYAAILQPQCCYGLNFSKSPAILIYSNDWSSDARSQLIERCDRPGKTGAGTRIVDFIHLPSDARVLERINEKIGIHNFTTTEIRRWFEE